MIYLDVEDLLHIAERAMDRPPQVRDFGLLGATCSRPQSTVDGLDAYSSVGDKAAALLHSLARNHALVAGNKRLALAATIAFLGMNGVRLRLTNDQAYDLVMDIAAGRHEDVAAISSALKTRT